VHPNNSPTTASSCGVRTDIELIVDGSYGIPLAVVCLPPAKSILTPDEFQADALAHCDMGLLGSASRMVTPAPFSASSVANSNAAVDFPAPPLGLAKTMVGTANESCKEQQHDHAA
jgi:hypothetical protein